MQGFSFGSYNLVCIPDMPMTKSGNSKDRKQRVHVTEKLQKRGIPKLHVRTLFVTEMCNAIDLPTYQTTRLVESNKQ